MQHKGGLLDPWLSGIIVVAAGVDTCLEQYAKKELKHNRT